MVTIDDLRFIANFKYVVKKNVTTDPMNNFKKLVQEITDIEESAKKNFDSICNETMVGFVMKKDEKNTMENHTITCFFAEKDKSQLYEEQVAIEIQNDMREDM